MIVIGSVTHEYQEVSLPKTTLTPLNIRKTQNIYDTIPNISKRKLESMELTRPKKFFESSERESNIKKLFFSGL